MSYSWKQKINTKSSTEAELVGVDDSLAYILWARYFLQEQGYDMEPSLLYQDNMSAILLETNGKASSSKRTKHIKVKYFYIKDKIDQDEIVVEHCPTDQMWTDINTKPKQGAVFREFRGQVMGILGDYVDSVFEHSIYLRPPNSPVGYEPWDPTSEPTMSLGRTMLPVPYPKTAEHRRSVLKNIGSTSRQMAGGLRWRANLRWRATPTSEERRGLLSYGCAVSAGAQECIARCETARTPSRGSMGESFYSSSHFLILISDY